MFKTSLPSLASVVWLPWKPVPSKTEKIQAAVVETTDTFKEKISNTFVDGVDTVHKTVHKHLHKRHHHDDD